MKIKAMIWTESVYKHKFHCNLCGVELVDKNGNPHPYALIELFPGWYRCRRCGNPVVREEYIEVPDGTLPGLYGNYAEFLKRDIEIPNKGRSRKLD